ncbi:MAG: cyclic nucleotide-binding domain-containing protein, partial [Planctomycetota bacterium]|nr:cyclic nucleotide-binding domain-containing protein [Planctomycetota bacterium]
MKSGSVVEFLKGKVTLFKSFPEAKLAELVNGSRVSTFEPKEPIIQFGSEGLFLGVVLEGEAEVSVTDDGGKKHQINILKPGDIFGEMSLMTGDKTMADITGVTRCKILLIPNSLFTTILTSHPPAITLLSKTIT